MPVGPVDDNGTVLYYEDGGPPAGSTDYVTLILVHGTLFHSAIYKPMLPFASTLNLRLVMLNLRDYSGSTRYSPEEIAVFSSPDSAVQASAIRQRGIELAAFMKWYVETEKVPPLADSAQQALEGGKATGGGVVMLGWSAGNPQTIPVLAYAHELPQDTRDVLARFFRGFIMFDPSRTGMGLPPLAGLYSPFVDTALTPAQLSAIFPSWVSSYFTPTGLAPSDGAASPGFVEMLLQRVAVHELTNANPRWKDARWAPTVQTIEKDVLPTLIDPDVMVRSQNRLQRVNLAVYHANTQRALFESAADEAGNSIWPRLRVHLVWCDMTIGDTVYAANEVKRLVKEHQQAHPGTGRNVEFWRLDEANHFAHWEEPKRFTELLSSIV